MASLKSSPGDHATAAPDRVAALVSWLVVGLAALGCVGCLIIRFMPDDLLLALGDHLATDKTADGLAAAIAPIQRRAGWLGLTYALGAVVLLAIRPWVSAAVGRVFEDTPREGRRLGRSALLWFQREPLAVALVVGLTLGFAVMAGLFLSQPIRTDEATSYLNYATRNPLIALLSYQSTNNHMLHSLMMWASVAALGDKLWAIRLPAYLAGVMVIPLTYFAARVWCGRPAALLGVGFMASSTYMVDFATNARGYTLITALFLFQLALWPRLVKGSSAAWLLAIFAAVLGLWTVPIMLMPLGILGTCLVIHALSLPRASARRLLARLVLTAFITAALTAVVYTPAILGTGFTNIARPEVVSRNSGPLVFSVLGRSMRILAIAASDWLYGWPAWIKAAVWLAITVGGVRAWLARSRGGTLGLGTILGTLGILLAVGAVPPLWSWFFLLPLFACALGGAGAWGLSRCFPLRRPPDMILVGLVLALALANARPLWRATYPPPPWAVDYPDARAAATILHQHWNNRLAFTGKSIFLAPIRYYLQKQGIGHNRSARATVNLPLSPDKAHWPKSIFLIRPRHHMDPTQAASLNAAGYRIESRTRLPDSIILRLRRPSSKSSGSR